MSLFQKDKLLVRIFLSLSVLLISAAIDMSLIYAAFVLELLILFFSLNFQNFFLFFRLISLILYFSYFLENGIWFTYGGDDLGFVYKFLVNKNWLDFDTLISGNILNFPLFYIINKFFYEVFLTNIKPELVSLHLVVINNLVLALSFLLYKKISISLFKKDYSLYLLLFTPFIYVGSIYLRDVYNFLLYALAFYSFISQKRYSIQIVIACFLLSFFIRPETSLVFLAIVLVYDRQIFYKTISIMLMIFIGYTYWPIIESLFRDFDQLTEIYDQTGLGYASEGGLGETLRTSDNILMQIIWYIYNFFRPVPPYIFIEYTFENLFQSIGNFFWYFSVSLVLLNIKNVIKNKILFFNILLFTIYVFGVSFFGGTQRHFLMFTPIIIMHSIHLNRSLQKKSLLIIIGFILLAILYFISKL